MPDYLTAPASAGPGRSTERQVMTDNDMVMRQARERVEREMNALALVLDRAEISAEDLETTRAVLRKIALVELDDLCVPPGFNLLENGEVASVNQKTPQWQFYQDAQTFVGDANHME